MEFPWREKAAGPQNTNKEEVEAFTVHIGGKHSPSHLIGRINYPATFEDERGTICSYHMTAGLKWGCP